MSPFAFLYPDIDVTLVTVLTVHSCTSVHVLGTPSSSSPIQNTTYPNLLNMASTLSLWRLCDGFLCQSIQGKLGLQSAFKLPKQCPNKSQCYTSHNGIAHSLNLPYYVLVEYHCPRPPATVQNSPEPSKLAVKTSHAHSVFESGQSVWVRGTDCIRKHSVK